MDSAYILNRRPFRDNRFIVDLLTQESGRITCVARVAKKRGKIMQGTLEPFRRLAVDWIGKGEMSTLTMAEEQRRYAIQPQDLCKGLYFNELILKLVPLFAPAKDVFIAYQAGLNILTTTVDNMPLIQCESGLLATLGHRFDVDSIKQQLGQSVEASRYYRYSVTSGLRVYEKHQEGMPISGGLLLKWQQQKPFIQHEYDQLRQFLNGLFDDLLDGKRLKSRKLVFR